MRKNYNLSRMLLLSQSLCCFIGKEIIIAKSYTSMDRKYSWWFIHNLRNKASLGIFFSVLANINLNNEPSLLFLVLFYDRSQLF